jgi:hypothetical protein
MKKMAKLLRGKPKLIMHQSAKDCLRTIPRYRPIGKALKSVSFYNPRALAFLSNASCGLKNTKIRGLTAMREPALKNRIRSKT